MYDIGIVIVNYNVRHFLVQCLQSVRTSRLEGLCVGVWVVDNASVDGATHLLKKDFPEVHLIENTENVGFSKANNQAIRQMNARYILLLNPDTILEEDTLIKSYRYMESHPECGALGVRMIDGQGNFLPESKRAIPDVWNSFCKLTYLSRLFPRSRWFSGYNLGYLPENKTASIEVLCGAYMFIRKESLDKTGLLDERFFMYGEDIDLSYRILQAGYTVVYYPETSIIHFKGESTKKATLTYVRTFYGAMSLYVNKHYTGRESAFFRWFILFAIQIRALLSAAGKFLKIWLSMGADSFFIALGLHGIKAGWASLYFDDPSYYQDTFIHVNIIIYTVIWVAGLWFFGRYDHKKSVLRLLSGVISGLVLILVVYALEPEHYRTSRALILLGAVGVYVYVLVTEWLLAWFKKPDNRSRTILIVAREEESARMETMLSVDELAGKAIFYINPVADEWNSFYTNHIGNLAKTVSQLKADELIFSSSSLSIKDIMEYMTRLPNHIDFKIAGDESLGIIGKKIPGKSLYSLDIHFPLDDGFWRRVKSITDITMALIFILLSPVMLVLNVGKWQFLKNCFQVLIQQKTWIGYGGDTTDYSFLPVLPKAVVPFPMAGRYFIYQEGHFKNKNVEYAKNYSPITDFVMILSNVTNLYGK